LGQEPERDDDPRQRAMTELADRRGYAEGLFEPPDDKHG